MPNAFDPKNIGVAKGSAAGYAWVGGTGDTLPKDAKTTINEQFKSLGYVSEDGLTNSAETDTEDYKDWSGSTVKSAQTSFSETYQVSLLESKADVLKVIYGDANVVDDSKGSITVKHNGKFGEERAYIFESAITETLIKRTVIPRGVVVERDDISENSSDLLAYTPTIKALPDKDGNTSYTYYYDSSKAGA